MSNKIRALKINQLKLTIILLSMIVLSFGIVSVTGEIPKTGTNHTDREVINKSVYISILSPSTGDTIFTPASDADKTIKFKKDSGDDLDQYLFRDSSPIDVYLDLKDLNPDPSITQKPKMTLRYWDVDRTGPSVADCPGGPEIDTVAINGHQLPQELTGQSDEWNIKTYDIEPGWLTKGENHFQVNIDTTNTGCWAVLVDWVEIKIPFNIKVTKVESFNDLDILDNTGAAIPDAIWEKKFDTSGNLIDVSPVKNYPIADWFKSNKFKFKITVDAWPKKPPNFVPKVTYWWENSKVLGTAPTISSPVLNFDGWTKDYDVDLPQKVSQRQVANVFIFKNSNGEKVQTDPQDTKHKLYVTINKAEDVTDITGPSPKKPKVKWLEIATKWGIDADTEEKGLTGIFNNEYGKPPNEFGWQYPTGIINWNNYVGIDGASHGECYVHRDALRALAGVLGVKTGKNNYIQNFITGTKPALDNNLFAHAKNTTNATPNYDRWVFASHAQTVFGSGDKYWDVTFGRRYDTPDKAAFAIYDHHNATTGMDIYIKGSNKCSVKYKGPGAAAGKDGWSIYDYACSPAPLIEYAKESGKIIPVSDYGLDTDNDTLYNYLVSRVKVNITTNGTYGIVGNLNIGNNSFLGSLDTKTAINSEVRQIYRNFTSGNTDMNLYFIGKNIFDSMQNGKYTINITLLNQTGAIVNFTSNKTNNYNYTKFQGLRILINNITDYGNDTNADGQYDFLTISLDSTILSPINLSITGFLEKNKSQISSIKSSVRIGSCSHCIIRINFPASDIRQKRVNGPYNLTLIISDSIFNSVIENKTKSYLYNQFGKPPAEFNNIFSDSGKDTNSNGLFDILKINVGLKVNTPGNYTVLGFLGTGTGNIITSTQNSSYLDISKNITLNFNGKDIYRSKNNGSLKLRFLQLFNNSGLIDNIDSPYTTKRYNYTQFEPTTVFTGKFNDTGIDNDSDSLFNILQINAQLDVKNSGNYSIYAYLSGNLSGRNTIIEDINFVQKLSKGIQNISLNFTGEKIFLSKINGPYNLSFIRISNNIPNSYIEDQIDNAYITKKYNYKQFEKPSIFIAGYSDSGIDIDSNGLFNILRIKINITTNKSGNYAINGRILDPNKNEISWAASHSSFVANIPQTINLDFDGFDIRANGISGNYSLKDLSVFEDSGTPSQFITDAFITKFYNYTQFEIPGFIKGKVTYPNGTAIQSVVVFYVDDTKITDINGNYSLIVRQNGTYDVKAIPPPELNLSDNETTVDAFLGSTVNLNFTLYRPSNLSGRILDKDSNPVSGAYITLLNSSTSTFMYNYSDDNGNYTFEKVKNGYYNISVTPPFGTNLLSNNTNIAILPESTNKLDIILQQGGIIQGFITMNSGKIPLEGIYVYATAGFTYQYSYTDIYGKYIITGLSTDNYTVYVSPPYGFSDNQTNIQVIAGNTYNVNLSLQPTLGVITGIVKVDSIPLKTILINTTNISTIYSYTNELGRYYVFGLDNGTYNVTAEPYDYMNLTRNSSIVNVITGQIKIVNFNLNTTGALLTGIVTDTSKNAISGAFAYVIGPSFGYDYTNSLGRYMVFNLINGTHNATIYPPYGSGLAINASDVNMTVGEVTIKDFVLQNST